MVSFDLSDFKIINDLIERDSKDATYKYALIRGAIEVFQKYDHYKTVSENDVSYPLGLLIERWLLYYYPIFESRMFIPQMSADKRYCRSGGIKPKFMGAFDPVIGYYRINGGFSRMYSDYRNGNIPEKIRKPFLDLLLQIRNTMVDMPMCYLGHSLHDKENEIFRADKDKPRDSITEPVDPMFLVKYYGTFFVKRKYHEAFINAGPFLIGDNSILFRWAQFSEERCMEDKIRFGDILRTIADSPVEERDIADSKEFFDALLKERGVLISVWSDSKIASPKNCNLDHMIPFSLWKNNELWNIMPTLPKENSDKSDKIPSVPLLESRRTAIIGYWADMMKHKPLLFSRQIRYSLVGDQLDPQRWKEQAFDSLVKKCRHMTDDLGYPVWNQ